MLWTGATLTKEATARNAVFMMATRPSIDLHVEQELRHECYSGVTKAYSKRVSNLFTKASSARSLKEK